MNLSCCATCATVRESMLFITCSIRFTMMSFVRVDNIDDIPEAVRMSEEGIGEDPLQHYLRDTPVCMVISPYDTTPFSCCRQNVPGCGIWSIHRRVESQFRLSTGAQRSPRSNMDDRQRRCHGQLVSVHTYIYMQCFPLIRCHNQLIATASSLTRSMTT